MSASTAHLEVDDTLQLAVVDDGARLSIQLDRERALQVGATLIEFALRKANSSIADPRSTPHLSWSPNA